MTDLKFAKSFEARAINYDWQGIIARYIYYGYHPGSFFEALLQNNFIFAAVTSASRNDWNEVQEFGIWLSECAPPECYGSIENVKKWIAMSDDQRREYSESVGLIDTVWDKLNTPA